MFFFKFKKNSHKQDEDSTSLNLQPLYEGDKGINELHANDAELRIYVSEPVWVAMKQVNRRFESTLAAYLPLAILGVKPISEIMCYTP